MLNRCRNILILFSFNISSELADFVSARSERTVGAFLPSFQALKLAAYPVAMMPVSFSTQEPGRNSGDGGVKPARCDPPGLAEKNRAWRKRKSRFNAASLFIE
jgi:hypothetical protein